jgi:hypothetical protein
MDSMSKTFAFTSVFFAKRLPFDIFQWAEAKFPKYGSGQAPS